MMFVLCPAIFGIVNASSREKTRLQFFYTYRGISDVNALRSEIKTVFIFFISGVKYSRQKLIIK